MPRSDGNRENETVGDNAPLSVDRRSYLKLAGVAAGSASMLSGTASAAFTRRGIRFKRSVDMVADAGCDPTGNEPCDQQIQNAADDYTLLKFPPGEYKITERNVILNTTNLGFLGEGDVRFTVPERYNERIFIIDDGTGLLFENIDIDLRAAGATPGLHFGVDDDLEVHDIEYIGQGIHPGSDPRGKGNGNPDVTYALYPIIRSPDGTGTVSNVVAKNAGLMGAYNHGDGRVGVWIGLSHVGTVTLEDCQFEGFPNNGLYCSRTGGAVQVEGGIFRNNDITQVRLSSQDSHVKNAVVAADFDNSDSPNPGDTLNSRGVRFEAGRFGYSGASVENCDIAIISTPHSGGGVVVGNDGANHSVRNTRIRIDVDTVRGIYAKAPVGFGGRSPPPKPHTATLENVSVTGSAAGTSAIRIDQRDDSVVSGCCIHQEGGSRDGVRLVDADGSKVVNSTIDVTGQGVVEQNSWIRIRNIDASGSCPTPDLSGGGGGSELPHTLRIEGTGGWTDYSFTVDGSVEPVEANGHDDVRTDGASGHVGGGVDRYAFSGEIVAFDLDGKAGVTVDGASAHVGQRPNHALKINGAGGWTDYSFTVDGSVEPVQVNDHESVRDNGASGHVGGGIDYYGFSGELVAFDLDGEANVTIDGKSAHVGRRPNHVLTIRGAGGWTDYSFTVSGSVDPIQTNDHESVRDDGASGHVGGGVDRYAFSGELVAFDLDGEANVTVDGASAHVGQRPDHVLTIRGAGGWTDYSFTVDGNVEPIQTNDHESVRNNGAEGHVGGGVDRYAFSGELVAFDLDGEANVTIDGAPAHVGQRPDHVLRIAGGGSRAEYTVSVSSDIEKTRASELDSTVSGRTASGYVVGYNDSYAFSGNINLLNIDGKAQATLNRNNRTITVEGNGQGANYSFRVNGDVEGVTHEPNAPHSDTVRTHGAEGFVKWGNDTYRYSGNLKSLTVGGVTVTIER